jgi:hypothetical protein
MAESQKQGLLHPERLKWFRNMNLMGAAALAGAGIVLPQYKEVLFLGAAINAVQALGAEALRLRKTNKPATAQEV